MIKQFSYMLFALALLGCHRSTQTAQASGTVEEDSTPMVYICNSPWAECYHLYENCEGLDNCSSSVKQVSLAEAEKKGRRPCGYCTRN